MQGIRNEWRKNGHERWPMDTNNHVKEHVAISAEFRSRSANRFVHFQLSCRISVRIKIFVFVMHATLNGIGLTRMFLSVHSGLRRCEIQDRALYRGKHITGDSRVKISRHI